MDNQIYLAFLEEIKSQISSARIQASKAVNREQILLYWQIGKMIVEKQEIVGWGKSIVEQLAKDLKLEFPNTQGFSARNIWDMRKFYLTYKDEPKLRQLVAEIPWKHNLLIMSLPDKKAQAYYLEASAKFGWTRNVLTFQIKGDAFNKLTQKNKSHNFEQTMPETLALQADEMLKSDYSLDFLGLSQIFLERELEQKIMENIKIFLLELGYGFTFIGQQYRIVLGKKEYFIDLLFFHRKLKCLVAIDLKIGEFEPEHAGKMNFYLEVLDNSVKMPDENPSIGIILCSKKDDLEVEYALRIANRPMGVAEYAITHQLPKELQNNLPNPQDLKKLLKRRR
jgi:predicted nuclease of restriction endonuclease-like (RecB) superfamily